MFCHKKRLALPGKILRISGVSQGQPPNDKMNTTPTPPPLPPEARGPGRLITSAALLGLLGPIAVFLLYVFYGAFDDGKAETPMTTIQLTLLATGSGLFILSLVAALYATLARYNRANSSCHKRGVAGLVILGLIIVAHLQKAEVLRRLAQQKSKEQSAKTKAAVDRLNEDWRKDFQESGGTNSGQQHLERLQAEYQKASANLSGYEKLTFEAGAAYTAKLQSELKQYEQTAEEMKAAEVLAPATNSTREQLAQNRKIVQRFVAANDSFSNFVANASLHFQAEMQARKIPEKIIELNLKGFNQTSARQRPVIQQIRATDARIGQATLSLLELLDTHFGRWRKDLQTGQLILPDEATVQKYQELLAEIDTAAEEQGKLQERLYRLK